MLRERFFIRNAASPRGGKQCRRPIFQRLETRRLLAGDVDFRLGTELKNGASYTCDDAYCPSLDLADARDYSSSNDGTVGKGFGILNTLDRDVADFNVRLEGEDAHGVFGNAYGSCLGSSVLLGGRSCGLVIEVTPDPGDPVGTVYGGDPSQALLVISGKTRGGKPVAVSLEFVLTYTVRATSEPPTADAGPAQSGLEDELLTFDASSSSDPEGDPLTYHWDFGDGQTAQTSDATVSHAYAWGGTFDVVLTVDDGHGNQATDTTTATVTEINDVPLADASGPYSGFENSALTFDASASFDFDNLDGTPANDQTLHYTWDFGDGTDPVTTTSVTIDHTYATAATYSVTLTVSDGLDADTASTTAVIDVAPAGDENDIYVWDIGFDSRSRGKHTDYRIEIDVHRDADADGTASSIDASAAGVYVTVELRDAGGKLVGTYTGTTGSDGIFRTDWIRGLSGGSYTAEVIDMAHETYEWNHLLDPTENDLDTDDDGLPEDMLVV